MKKILYVVTVLILVVGFSLKGGTGSNPSRSSSGQPQSLPASSLPSGANSLPRQQRPPLSPDVAQDYWNDRVEEFCPFRRGSPIMSMSSFLEIEILDGNNRYYLSTGGRKIDPDLPEKVGDGKLHLNDSVEQMKNFVFSFTLTKGAVLDPCPQEVHFVYQLTCSDGNVAEINMKALPVQSAHYLYCSYSMNWNDAEVANLYNQLSACTGYGIYRRFAGRVCASNGLYGTWDQKFMLDLVQSPILRYGSNPRVGFTFYDAFEDWIGFKAGR